MSGHKYGNTRVTEDGHTFDSKAEARRYRELRLLERAGEIGPVQVHPRFPLEVEGVAVGTYVADFAYDDRATGRRVIEDVKGVRTPVYKLKKKLLYALYAITIAEVGV